MKGEKFRSRNFGELARYIIEKVLRNNNYLVRKFGTDKTQVLHRMRMRRFTPPNPQLTYELGHKNGNPIRK